MMPMVTVWPTPKGLPMASATSPIWILLEWPRVMAGRSGRSILSTARSVSGSLPMTLARGSRQQAIARRLLQVHVRARQADPFWVALDDQQGGEHADQ